MAFCAKDQNQDFAWNVEQNYTLAQIKCMADILFQFLKSSARLFITFFGFCSFVLALKKRNVQEAALGGQCKSGSISLPVGSSEVCPSAHHPLAPHCADVSVSITQVYVFG